MRFSFHVRVSIVLESGFFHSVGRLQFVSIAGCRTKSVEILIVMFASFKLLPILHFRLFLRTQVTVVRYSYIELNRQNTE
jgi:hypothetical protein